MEDPIAQTFQVGTYKKNIECLTCQDRHTSTVWIFHMGGVPTQRRRAVDLTAFSTLDRTVFLLRMAS